MNNIRFRPTVRFLLVGSIAFGIVSIFAISCRSPKPQVYRQTRFLMDTVVEITVVSEQEQEALRTIEAAYAEMQRIDSLLSRYQAGSQISEVNRQAGTATPVQVRAEVAAIVARSVRYSATTGGLFDITLAPLIDLWGIGTEQERVPGTDEIQVALTYAGADKIELSGEQGIRLHDAGMGLDLGGIAKGYAVDRAIAVLRDHHITNALINAGGDIRCIGVKPGGTKWRIGIQHPRKPTNEILEVLELQDRAVATSGDYERFFMQEGVRYHHIFDPRTGMPARGCQSVTILAGTAEAADVFATAVFVMGPEQGMQFLEAETDIEGMIVRDNGEIVTSSGFTFQRN